MAFPDNLKDILNSENKRRLLPGFVEADQKLQVISYSEDTGQANENLESW